MDGVEAAESGMEMRDLLNDVEFAHRRPRRHAAGRNFEALHQLARAVAEAPERSLDELVQVAVEFCGADSAGISLEERDESGPQRFRWVAIAGSFARYRNATAPRFFSPCGKCLSAGRPQLYRVTKPYFDYLGVEAEPITDGILIPWIAGEERGTIWAVAHHSRAAFAPDDYQLLQVLGDLAAMAVRHQAQMGAVRERERGVASADRANELAHQINNPLQTLTNTLYLARQGGPEAAAALDLASHELEALSGLVAEMLCLRSELTGEKLSMKRPPGRSGSGRLRAGNRG